jgi:hypothetical protein
MTSQLQIGFPFIFALQRSCLNLPALIPRDTYTPTHAVNRTTMNYELTNILACDRPIRAQLEQRLSTLSRREKLSLLVDIFRVAGDSSEHVAEVVAEAWSYLQQHQLWNVQYDTLTAFQKDIEFEDGVLHILERHKKVLARMQTACEGIQKKWGGFLPDLLGPLMPPRCTRHLLEMLHRLSKMCPFERAKELFEEAISARLKVPKASKTRWITQGDVSKVLSKLKLLQPPAAPVTQRNGSPRAKRPKLSQQADTNERTADPMYRSKESSNSDRMSTFLLVEYSSGSESEPQEECLDLQLTRAETTMATPMLDCLPASEDETLTMSSQTHTNSVWPSNSCQCPALMKEMDFHGRHCQPLAILHQVAHFGLARLCDDHLRLLAHVAADLRVDIPASKLRRRLQGVHRYNHRLARLRLRKPYWFVHPDSRANNEDCPIYRHNALVPPPFFYNSTRVFERFAGHGTHSSWLRDGSITVTNVHDYLKDFGVLEMIETEFNMYRYHHQSPNSDLKNSALRNMYYSGIQQLLRQDPIAYALNAAASPNGNWRLITYPDIALDGVNVSSTPKALSTVQDLGIHFRNSDISTLDIMQSNVIIERTLSWSPGREGGHAVPAANISLELSRADTFDESTLRKHKFGQVLQGWYCVIDEDHNFVGSGCDLSWEDLAACHRDLEAPFSGPCGHLPLFGRPTYRFPSSIILDSTSALGDALVGRRKWNDPQVLLERNIVLGDDDDRARAFVKEVRKKLVNRYLELFQVLESVEWEAFGEHSYFRSRDTALRSVS